MKDCHLKNMIGVKTPLTLKRNHLDGDCSNLENQQVAHVRKILKTTMQEKKQRIIKALDEKVIKMKTRMADEIDELKEKLNLFEEADRSISSKYKKQLEALEKDAKLELDALRKYRDEMSESFTNTLDTEKQKALKRFDDNLSKLAHIKGK